MPQYDRAKSVQAGKLIAKHRKKQQRSARDVAREAGIDIHTMVKLEKGAFAAPSPMTLTSVARALGIPVLEIFRVAGYITPYDLVDLVTSPRRLADEEADAERNRYVEELIETHGLLEAPPSDDTF